MKANQPKPELPKAIKTKIIPPAPPSTDTCQVLIIPDWIPKRVNQMIGAPWQQTYHVKKVDAQTIHLYAWIHSIRKATGRRRVSLKLFGWRRGRMSDPDAHWKSLLDGLVWCGLLIDDAYRFCELGTIKMTRCERTWTEITLEDIDPLVEQEEKENDNQQSLDSTKGNGRDTGPNSCDPVEVDQQGGDQE